MGAAADPVTVAISEKGSMIIPMPFALVGELPDKIIVGGTPLVRKAELHVTVFNYALGRLLTRAFVEQPRLRIAIDQEAATFDWTIKPGTTYYHLVSDAPDRPPCRPSSSWSRRACRPSITRPRAGR